MRLISLNIWGAQVYEPLMAFLKLHAPDTDIFCFQEIFNNAPGVPIQREVLARSRPQCFPELQQELSNFKGYFRVTQDNDESLALFVRNTIRVLE